MEWFTHTEIVVEQIIILGVKLFHSWLIEFWHKDIQSLGEKLKKVIQ